MEATLKVDPMNFTPELNSPAPWQGYEANVNAGMHIMNIAQQYVQQQLENAEFRQAYFEEKAKLDIEYQLEELKQAIRTNTSVEELIRKIDSIEQYVQAV